MKHTENIKHILAPVFCLCMAIGQPAQAEAQDINPPYGGTVAIMVDPAELVENTVTFRADIDLSALELPANSMITFSPMLRSLDGSREVVFEKVTVSGKRRNKVIRRASYFGDGTQAAPAYNTVVRGRKDNAEIIELEYVMPFAKWMRSSQLVITEQTSACCDDYAEYTYGHKAKVYTGNPYVFPEPYMPTFTVSYMVPQAESAKVMSETYTAALGFQVNKTDLLRNFGNNANILDEVDMIVKRVQNDPLLTISAIAVRGYASPEGNEASNMRLSHGRAQAFVVYLQGKLGYTAANNLITAHGMGEDWAGLRKAVEASYIDDRERILNAIDANPDINRRKAAIKALSGGRTYRVLLNDYYPPLRRNEYTLSYEIRGFNAEEARDLVWTRPQLLSLNEFYMAAQLYEPDSKEFKEVFDIAARMYPASEIAQFNVRTMEIENGSYDTAIARLKGTDSPESWNNMGVAYWHKGEYGEAAAMFCKAADTGLAVAVENLAKYEKWSADRSE